MGPCDWAIPTLSANLTSLKCFKFDTAFCKNDFFIGLEKWQDLGVMASYCRRLSSQSTKNFKVDPLYDGVIRSEVNDVIRLSNSMSALVDVCI